MNKGTIKEYEPLQLRDTKIKEGLYVFKWALHFATLESSSFHVSFIFSLLQLFPIYHSFDLISDLLALY